METTLQNETLSTLLKELGIEEEISQELNSLSIADSKFLKDLRININNALAAQLLNKKQTAIIAFAVALNENNIILKKTFSKIAIQEGATSQEMAEVIACTSLMNTNNVYYRFKHFVKKEFYQNAQAGIRMSIMVNPILGKEFFELLSLAISAVNGCELCVTSHEESVLKNGGSSEKILEAVRIAAIVKGFSAIFK